MRGKLTQIPIDQLVNMDVSSASKIARQISDAPSAVSIVTAQDIKAYGYHTIGDILASMRGLYITSDRAYSFLGGRGFGRPGDFTGRIMLMLDGRPVNNNIYGSAGLEYTGIIDVSLIERVEYVSGPGSIIYGNNAFFGIVNIVSKKAHDINGVQAIGEVASYETGEGKINYGKRFDNGAELLLSGSGATSRGQTLFFPDSVDRANGIDGVSRGLDGQNSQHLFGKLEWENWFAEVAYSSRKKDIPTAPYGAQFNAPYNYEDTYLEASLKNDRQLSENLKLSLHGYYGNYEYRGLETFPVNYAWNENSMGQWSGLNAQFLGTWFNRQRIIFGVDSRFDLQQDIITPVSQSKTSERTFSFYAQDEIALMPQLIANIGARYDINSYVPDHISPRFALIYTLLDKTTFKLSWSSAYRRPNPFEKYYTDNQYLLQNPALKPEHIDAAELVIEHRFDTDTRLLGSIYHYQTYDLIESITIDPLLGTGQFSNVRGGVTDGVELEFEKHWKNGVRLRASAAYQEAIDGNGNWLVNSPRGIGKFNISAPIPRIDWRAAIEVQTYSDRKTEHESKIGGYSLANLTISSDRLLPNLGVSFGIRNLLDKDYVNVAPSSNYRQITLPQDGRTYWLRLTYEFK